MTRFIEGKSLQFFLKPGQAGMRVIGRSEGRCSGSSSASPVSTCCRTSPTSSRASATWPRDSGPRPTRQRAACRQGHDLRARDGARTRADRRSDLLLAQARRGAAAVRWRRRQQGPPRLPVRGAGRAPGRNPTSPSSGCPVDLERSLDGNRENAEFAAKVRETFERYRVLPSVTGAQHRPADAQLDSSSVIEVPYFDEDVYDIGGLAQVGPLSLLLDRGEACDPGRAIC